VVEVKKEGLEDGGKLWRRQEALEAD